MYVTFTSARKKYTNGLLIVCFRNLYVHGPIQQISVNSPNLVSFGKDLS